uniref:Uncharacterized protein n=1 Tax=Anguilla anguilla TaxID=7936 RepID=A0A0E9PR14_ANGAN
MVTQSSLIQFHMIVNITGLVWFVKENEALLDSKFNKFKNKCHHRLLKNSIAVD